MLASQPMTLKNKNPKTIPGWPKTLVILGIALTIIWLALLILGPLRLLQVV
jgi:hypothetical protein